MCHGERTEMEDFCLRDKLGIYFIFREHHVSSRVTVERKFAVPVRKCMDERQCCIYRVIDHQMRCVDSRICDRISQQCAELVLSYFPEECRLLSHFIEESQNIARRSARACLKHIVSLFALSVHREIDQELAKGDHIIFFLHLKVPPADN